MEMSSRSVAIEMENSEQRLERNSRSIIVWVMSLGQCALHQRPDKEGKLQGPGI